MMTPNQLRKSILDLAREHAAGNAPLSFVPDETPIPASGKIIDGDEIATMIDACLDGWLTTGRFNADFEARLATRIGVAHALTCNSGSSANLLAFSALTSPLLGERAIRPGDEVITVAAGFPTTVNPILQCGAVPVFVDVGLSGYNADPERVRAAVTEKTRAIMLAHTLGNPWDIDAIGAIAAEHGLWLVEDCCDALGSTWRGRHVGTFGDIGTLSFYPAHHITMGEGGAVFTNNPILKRAAESIRDWGRDCYCAPGRDNTCGRRFQQQLGDLPCGYDHKYTYSHLGYNLKISDMQAACGLAQLDKADAFITARRENFAYLRERLTDCADFVLLPEATPGSTPSWFGFPLTLREVAQTDRVELLRYLDQYHIGTRLLFGGNLTRQPYMRGRNYRVCGTLENTERILRDTFWVGIWPGLSKPMLDHIAYRLETYFGVNF